MSKNFLSDYLCRPLYEPYDTCVEHFCPGCNQMHLFAIEKPFNNGAQWTWNGDVNKPTFHPSMNIVDRGIEGDMHSSCHYWLKEGKIQYLSDCTHKLKGKTIDLPKIPDRYRKEGK